MLTFIGLGLYDAQSVTVAGRDALGEADAVYAEFYTSRLMGTSIEALAKEHGTEITVMDRNDVEGKPEELLRTAETNDVAFLTAGDPMTATTHVDLRLRATDRDIETRIIHGVTAETAAYSLCGLQNYRFGRSTTLPFPWAHGGENVPESVRSVIETNQREGSHTLVYLDIKVDDPYHGDRGGDDEPFMRASRAAELLAGPYPDLLGVVIARAGSEEPLVQADRIADLATMDFGDPLHLLVIPGEVHDIEREALIAFADADPTLLD